MDNTTSSGEASNAKQSASNRAINTSNASQKKQGWDRQAYNAYQRMYMAVRRAVLGGRACWMK